MKILFTVYDEDHETEERVLRFSKIISTDMEIEEIDDKLQLYDGFHSMLVAGESLTFWDIYCFFDITQDVIEKINNIPKSQKENSKGKEPKVLCIEEFDPGNADAPIYPDRKMCFIYRITRYECGASGFDAIVIWASNHPWLMVFIGGLVWDMTKLFLQCVGKLLRNVCGYKIRQSTIKVRKKVVCFEVAKFYRNFSRLTNLAKRDCQIVCLKRIKGGNFEVHVRTINDSYFVVKSKFNGKISSLNIEQNGKDETK